MLVVLNLCSLYIHYTHAALNFQFSPNNKGFLMKRDDFNSDFTSSSTAAPIIELYFGSNKQKIPLMLDSGSFTPFVQSTDVSEDQGFDYEASSSYQDQSDDFNVAYADSTRYKGSWGDDNVSNDKNGDGFNLTFGLVKNASTNGVSSDSNVFGLGFDYNQPTLMDQLKDKNIISRKTFSIYSSANDHSLGQISFGAIDSAKYNGDLVSVPLRDQSNGYVWWTYMTDLSAGCESATGGNIYYISFDCGYTTGVTVPSAVHDKIVNNFDAFYESESQNYVFDCDNASPLVVEVMGHKIEIPASGFTKKVKNSHKCIFQNINKGSEDDTVYFGWVFFPYIYGVFDAENKEILFGKPKTDTSDSNIKEVSNSIPGSTQAASYSSVSNIKTTHSISTKSISTKSSSIELDSTGVTSSGSCTSSVAKAVVSPLKDFQTLSVFKAVSETFSAGSNSSNVSSSAPVANYEDSCGTLSRSGVFLAMLSIFAFLI